jgi:hypothetical protein
LKAEKEMESASPELISIACRSLLPGEQLLWVGAPTAADLFAKYFPVSVFGLFFCAVLFIMARFNRPKLLTIDNLPVIPFAIAAGLILFMAPISAALQPRWESYAITNQRAIITRIRPLGSHSFTSNEMFAPEITYREIEGDILFHKGHGEDRSGNPVSWNEGFFYVRKPVEVAKLIEQVRIGEPVDQTNAIDCRLPDTLQR